MLGRFGIMWRQFALVMLSHLHLVWDMLIWVFLVLLGSVAGRSVIEWAGIHRLSAWRWVGYIIRLVRLAVPVGRHCTGSQVTLFPGVSM
jgi:hypothetical protein